jgi:hypothetical protein
LGLGELARTDVTTDERHEPRLELSLLGV